LGLNIRLKQILVEVGVFQRGWVTLRENFRWKGISPTNLCWYQKTRVITRSCGINILTVCPFISSQSMRVMDGLTDRQTNRQNYDPQDRASIAASCSKNDNYNFCWQPNAQYYLTIHKQSRYYIPVSSKSSESFIGMKFLPLP